MCLSTDFALRLNCAPSAKYIFKGAADHKADSKVIVIIIGLILVRAVSAVQPEQTPHQERIKEVKFLA